MHLQTTSQRWLAYGYLALAMALAGSYVALSKPLVAVLPVFHLPLEGIALVVGVDHILDMGRSATNVVGNSVATVVVSKWEGLLGPAMTAAEAPATTA